MQSGTGECFDLVWMSVCVCVSVVGLRYGDFIWFYLLLWFTGKAQALTSQFESHWAVRGEFGSSCATPTRSCSKWSLTLSRWRCFSLTHTHRYTHTWCQRSSHRCRLRAKWTLHPPNCSFYLALLLSFLLSLSLCLLHTCCSLLVGGRKLLLLRLLFCSLFCSEFHFEWRRRFQGNFCFFFPSVLLRTCLVF